MVSQRRKAAKKSKQTRAPAFVGGLRDSLKPVLDRAKDAKDAKDGLRVVASLSRFVIGSRGRNDLAKTQSRKEKSTQTRAPAFLESAWRSSCVNPRNRYRFRATVIFFATLRLCETFGFRFS
jgi:hypothetical protein